MAQVQRLKRERGKEGKFIGLHRYELRLVFQSPDIVDLWHNSRGGYRAQYYLDCKKGDEANAYAIETLSKVVEPMIVADDRYKLRWPSAKRSIYHRLARIWIVEGLWEHHAKTTDRQLKVPRWQYHDPRDTCGNAKKLRTKGALIPSKEKRLVWNGQWLSHDGSPVDWPPKPKRATQINRYGYT